MCQVLKGLQIEGGKIHIHEQMLTIIFARHWSSNPDNTYKQRLPTPICLGLKGFVIVVVVTSSKIIIGLVAASLNYCLHGGYGPINALSLATYWIVHLLQYELECHNEMEPAWKKDGEIRCHIIEICTWSDRCGTTSSIQQTFDDRTHQQTFYGRNHPVVRAAPYKWQQDKLYNKDPPY
ncbi:hypothetical protein ACJX0J_011640 [Zea mays]